MGFAVDPDFLLVEKMRMGNEIAFETFVTKYYPKILKYCQTHIGDRDYAEDLTQETFVRFFRTLNRYRHYGKAANYLYTIASHVCRDYYRQVKEIPFETLPDASERCTQSPEEQVTIKDALNKLPPEIKEIAILFFIQELRQQDIATILGISLPLVKYRIKRARELLSASFKDDY